MIRRRVIKATTIRVFFSRLQLMTLLWPPGSVEASPGRYNTRNYISMH